MERLSEAGSQHAKMGCYRCAQPSPVVDLDVLIEGEGILCLCENCILEAANIAGVAPRTDPVYGELAAANAQLDDWKISVLEAETVIRTLLDAHRRLERRQAKEKEAAASE